MSETLFCPRCHQEMNAHGSKDALRAYSGCNYTVSDNEPPLTELELLRIQIPALTDAADKARAKLNEAIMRERQLAYKSSVLGFEDRGILRHIENGDIIVLATVQGTENALAAFRRVSREIIDKCAQAVAVVSGHVGTHLYEELRMATPMGVKVYLCHIVTEPQNDEWVYLPRNKSEWSRPRRGHNGFAE